MRDDISGRQLCQNKFAGSSVRGTRIRARKSHCDTQTGTITGVEVAATRNRDGACVSHTGNFFSTSPQLLSCQFVPGAPGWKQPPSCDSAGGFQGGGEGSRRVWRALGTTTTPGTKPGESRARLRSPSALHFIARREFDRFT